MTRICIEPSGGGAVRLDLEAGLLQPRLVTRGQNSAHVALVAGGAMLLGGDHVTVDVHVGAGCALEIEDVGGTVAYESRGSRSRFDVRIVVEDGGSLIWRAHPFVVTDGAEVDRDTTIALGEDAWLLLRETLVLGRTAERGGELMARMHARTALGAALLLEDLALSGTEPLAGVLGEHRVLDSAILLGRRPESGAQGNAAVAAPTILELDAPGAIARAVADRAHSTGVEAQFEAWAL
ncbi:urease accessory protein UreD [Brachybacterium sp. GCM10030268]|uniref:urease accessory protein UreD n=1 Tax=Brachybacterium sp. GCM10030268 TaxID=3273382 RepID=UPI003613E003